VPRIPVVRWLWRDPRRWYAAVALSVPLCCLLDATLLGGDGSSWVLAAMAWIVILGVLPELPPRRRAALLCFLPLITIAELMLSHVLGWYAYRIGHVPAWIPPAHGIVFITALRTIDTTWPSTRALAWAAATGQALYGLGALLLADDVLGALFGIVFVIGMIVLPPEGKRFYAGLGITVAYLELVGTAAGTWSWAATEFGLSEMNPPSGAVGGYSLVDGAAFLLAGFALWLGARLRQREPAEEALRA
jgi:hypothetical protein